MPLGASFGVTPAGLEEQAQRLKKRTPTQQALQTLSLKLPKVLGAGSAPPSDLMGGAYRPTIPGGGDASQARMAALVKAMTGKRAGAARPAAPPRFTGGAVQTPAPPPAAAQAAGPAKGMGGVKAAVKPLVEAAKPAADRVRSGLTGSRDPKKLAAAAAAAAAKAAAAKPPPINPAQIGGGLVDAGVSPPQQPNYMAGYRGSIWDGSAADYSARQQQAATSGAKADAQGRYIPTGGAPGYANRPY
jgi:hypothetical protein